MDYCETAETGGTSWTRITSGFQSRADHQSTLSKARPMGAAGVNLAMLATVAPAAFVAGG